MKLTLKATALAAALSLFAPAAALAVTLTLPAGTQINVTIDNTLDSATTKSGDTFTAHIVQPIPAGDEALQGGWVTGHVVKVQKAQQGRNPEIDLKFDQLQLSDGSSAAINATMTQAEPKAKAKSGAKVAIATLGGLLVGNAVAKTIFHASDHGLAGLAGAAGGFLIANNSRTDVQFPAGSTMTMQMQDSVAIRPQAR